MSWAAPLGFLGLLGIAVLVLIYLLKPNYQQKIVSSTYVWKLSLKYKKKRVPINRLRNLLILLCQILIITACAMILAWPIIEAGEEVVHSEEVLIIDASANMYATDRSGETRFERAVEMARERAEEVLLQEGGGYVTILLAGQNASAVVQSEGNLDVVNEQLDSLLDPDNSPCWYGAADVSGAMSIAQVTVDSNPDAAIYYYTGISYVDSGNVHVVNVDGTGEWNAAILEVTTDLRENSYVFTVDVACYGNPDTLIVNCEVFGANYVEGDGGTDLSMTESVQCDGENAEQVVFDTRTWGNAEDGGVSSYDYIHIYIEEDDSFNEDNGVYLYGGTREEIDVLYYSPRPNSFIYAMLMTLRETSENWTIIIDQQTGSVASGIDQSAPIEGYDVYIYEHVVPTQMPTDGVVIFFDITAVPSGLNITLGQELTGSWDELSANTAASHEVMNYVNPAHISVTKYRRLDAPDFVELMYCAGDPMVVLKNTPTEKVVIFSLDLNYSSFPLNYDFGILMMNMFNYYLPAASSQASSSGIYGMQTLFEIGETVRLNTRGSSLMLTGADGSEAVYESLPLDMTLYTPGTYTLMQTLLNDEILTDNFFVKVAAVQSNIFRTEDELANPVYVEETEMEDIDLLVYFAAALVALLFLEWWLQTRENY